MSAQSSQPKSKVSIPIFLKHFVGYSLSVELKTGRILTGTLDSADQHMNLVLQQAESQILHHHPSNPSNHQGVNCYSLVHIKGPSVRYIHFPQNLSLQGVISEGVNNEKAAQQRYARQKRQKR